MNLKEYLDVYGKDRLIFKVPLRPINVVGRIAFTSSDDETLVRG